MGDAGAGPGCARAVRSRSEPGGISRSDVWTLHSSIPASSNTDAGNSQLRNGRKTGIRAAANPVPRASSRVGAQHAIPAPNAGSTASSRPNAVRRHARARNTWYAVTATLTASSAASPLPSTRLPGLTKNVSQDAGRSTATDSNSHGARAPVSLPVQSEASCAAGPPRPRPPTTTSPIASRYSSSIARPAAIPARRYGGADQASRTTEGVDRAAATTASAVSPTRASHPRGFIRSPRRGGRRRARRTTSRRRTRRRPAGLRRGVPRAPCRAGHPRPPPAACHRR